MQPVQRAFRNIRSIGAIGAACLLLAACTGACTADRQAGSVLNRGLGPEPESMDVHKFQSTAASAVLRDIAEGLVGYTADGDLIPAAAQAWEVSEDGLEYRFALRPEARWSNGDPVTAEDWVYSFRRLVDPETAAFFAQTLIDVENAEDIIDGRKPPDALGVEATGDFELTVRLRSPLPYLLGLLTHPSAFPVHPPSVEAHGDAYARPGNLVSNGPYKLDAWEIGAVIDLSRNSRYWNDAATSIDRVRYFVTPETMTEINRYRAGELHVTSNIPPEAFQQMVEERPDEVRTATKLTAHFYGFNMSKPQFRDNPALREALSMAIDREDLVEKVIGRGEAPAHSWVMPGIDNYEPRRMPYSDMTTVERHAAARRAYRAAGFDDENPLQVEVRFHTSETQQRIAVAIQSMWRDVLGVETTLINEEFKVFLSNVRAADVTEIFGMAWAGDYNDAHTFLHIFESTSPSNLTGYASEHFDTLMQRAASQSDPLKRQLYLEQAEAELLKDHPIIPIYFSVSKHLIDPRVGGWGDNVLDYHYSHQLTLEPTD